MKLRVSGVDRLVFIDSLSSKLGKSQDLGITSLLHEIKKRYYIAHLQNFTSWSKRKYLDLYKVKN